MSMSCSERWSRFLLVLCFCWGCDRNDASLDGVGEPADTTPPGASPEQDGSLTIPASDAGCTQQDAACAATVPKAEKGCPQGLDEQACAQIRAFVLPSALPAAKGNAVADNEKAAILGFRIFFDIRFSQDQRVRCESCHSVDHGFADNQAVPTLGIGKGTRNAPTVFNAARHSVYLWDGRADSLWSQPLIALENPNEMNFSRLEVAHAVLKFYPADYQRVFGAGPDLSDAQRFPAAGKPGAPTFDGMSAADQETVNMVFANVGKALEAYIRKVATGRSRADGHLLWMFDDASTGMGAGPNGVLTPTEARGMVVFAKAGCFDCHNGPNLSDEAFHNLGVPSVPEAGLDEGRSELALAQLAESPFSAAGEFFDGDSKVSAPAPAVLGGFRTPSLRNLGRSQPYGHNGAFATLEDVVDFHLEGGGSDPNHYLGKVDPRLKKVELSADDRAALIAFLKALDGAYPALPWGQWPSGNG
jgi:cytochrome c peroxidase